MRKTAVIAMLCAALLLFCGGAVGSAVILEDRGSEIGESSVHFPAVSGIADTELERSVNDMILSRCGIRAYLDRMALLISGGSLRVEWDGGIGGDILSCTVSAEGNIAGSRKTHVWTAVTLDLTDGHEIGINELFTDEVSAEALICSLLEEEIGPGMSAHLQNMELTPLPELFSLTNAGLRLLYPVDRLSELSGRAGDIVISWSDLEDVLDLTPGGVADRWGVPRMLTLDAGSAEAIADAVSSGRVPGLPVTLGDALKPLTDKTHLLTDADYCLEGRLFAPEGGIWRGVLLLTDKLTEDWDHSVVNGIRLEQGCLFGLRIGLTDRTEWYEALGEPAAAAGLDDEAADENRVLPGAVDHYIFGGNRLCLYSDRDGTLRQIVIER
ncbi:MAG: hypothetical protein Q4G19_01355 [Clostridia bacterium]|nr:hypothetical protein [Clostridia bacterium]